ncbi:hypothetical protein F506_20555 [Herbaspirillum hiltneri N3]|uniref:Uncharacterized protein n=1 Tax=Herbaspirillum hiltneri N3 TaxID=1262470 RepID=A0ABN4I760_9BURK|nr:hypothetical protein F506_20555 [Herbaspirillum hiltneri N3]
MVIPDMLRTVYFNYQALLQTNKIQHVIFKRVLAAELDFKLLSTQSMPESAFCIGHRLSQLLCCELCKSLGLTLHW